MDSSLTTGMSPFQTRPFAVSVSTTGSTVFRPPTVQLQFLVAAWLVLYPVILQASTPVQDRLHRMEATTNPLWDAVSPSAQTDIWNTGLNGSGVAFAAICRSMTYANGMPQNDYLPDTSHRCFATTQYAFFNQSAFSVGVSDHATAVCSMLFGDDPEAFHREFGVFHYRGLVPEATANVYEFWHFISSYVLLQACPDVDIITTSLGGYFEDWWTRGLETFAEQYGVVIVASIGNGSNAGDTLLYPGAASNVIGVGDAEPLPSDTRVFPRGDDYVVRAEQSSAGPTLDGRCKPDLVAPGKHLVAVAGSSEDYRVQNCCSSLAAPFVAGVAGLLVERARRDPNLGLVIRSAGSNCVVKAILLNSAVKLPGWHKGDATDEDDHLMTLDYLQGAGVVNANSAHEHLLAGRSQPGDVGPLGWDNNVLAAADEQGNTYRFTAQDSAGTNVTATLVWNRHYDDAYPFNRNECLDADLRLELWAVNKNEALLIDYSDSPVDNVEHVFSSTVAGFTDYEIVVSGRTSDPAKPERYALAWQVSKAP